MNLNRPLQGQTFRYVYFSASAATLRLRFDQVVADGEAH
jgi:hypothetical protein